MMLHKCLASTALFLGTKGMKIASQNVKDVTHTPTFQVRCIKDDVSNGKSWLGKIPSVPPKMSYLTEKGTVMASPDAQTQSWREALEAAMDTGKNYDSLSLDEGPYDSLSLDEGPYKVSGGLAFAKSWTKGKRLRFNDGERFHVRIRKSEVLLSHTDSPDALEIFLVKCPIPIFKLMVEEIGCLEYAEPDEGYTPMFEVDCDTLDNNVWKGTIPDNNVWKGTIPDILPKGSYSTSPEKEEVDTHPVTVNVNAWRDSLDSLKKMDVNTMEVPETGLYKVNRVLAFVKSHGAGDDAASSENKIKPALRSLRFKESDRDYIQMKKENDTVVLTFPEAHGFVFEVQCPIRIFKLMLDIGSLSLTSEQEPAQTAQRVDFLTTVDPAAYDAEIPESDSM